MQSYLTPIDDGVAYCVFRTTTPVGCHKSMLLLGSLLTAFVYGWLQVFFSEAGHG
jgi:hypothetical protein